MKNFTDSNIDILGFQEHRIVHEEPVRYEEVDGKLLVTASAWRNDCGAANGGVGILLNSSARKTLTSIKPPNPRILIANFSGNPATTVMVTYSPSNSTSEDLVDNYYDNLRGAIEGVPAHNVLIIVGDFNAKIGKEDSCFLYHNETNRNGEMLLELSQETNVVICNTSFQKSKKRLWTHISPKGEKSQLDYFLIRRKWRNSVKNSSAYNNFASVGSDHQSSFCKS